MHQFKQCNKLQEHFLTYLPTHQNIGKKETKRAILKKNKATTFLVRFEMWMQTKGVQHDKLEKYCAYVL